LALMLANASIRLGLKPIVFADDSKAPAAQAHMGSVFGSTQDIHALECLFSQVNQVIFENEFVDCAKLKTASTQWKTQFFPGLDVISVLQDKLQQKELLTKLGIPTAEYLVLNSPYRSSLKSALERLGGSCVLKWARMGYDGRGVFQLNDHPETLSRAEVFCKEAEKWKSIVYAEKRIAFRRELAVVGVYSTRGEFMTYPLVISEQKSGICYRVYGPATAFGVSPNQEAIARSYAQKIAHAAHLVGSFAVELFETQSGELLVNEIAPRVHNSGHYTQDACETDQFENHWRAILGLPLGPANPRPGFAMLNILGPDSISMSGTDAMMPEPGPRTHLHWYQKGEIRPRRKLGHFNGSVESVGEMDSLLSELDTCYQKWVQGLTQSSGSLVS
jgi:5-(carboxyamino)imidazole ribonucleotide synthase